VCYDGAEVGVGSGYAWAQIVQMVSLVPTQPGADPARGRCGCLPFCSAVIGVAVLTFATAGFGRPRAPNGECRW